MPPWTVYEGTKEWWFYFFIFFIMYSRQGVLFVFQFHSSIHFSGRYPASDRSSTQSPIELKKQNRPSGWHKLIDITSPHNPITHRLHSSYYVLQRTRTSWLVLHKVPLVRQSITKQKLRVADIHSRYSPRLGAFRGKLGMVLAFGVPIQSGSESRVLCRESV